MADRYFLEKKFRKRALDMAELRYADLVDIPSFTAMEDTLGRDEVHTVMPEAIEGFEFKKGDHFTGRDRYLWLDREVMLPPEREGYDIVGLFDFGKTGDGFNSAFESLLYVNSEKYQGVDTFHYDVILNDYAGKDTRLTFLLWTGLEGGGPHVTHYHQFRKAKIGYLHKASDELYYFTRAIAETIAIMDENDENRYVLEGAMEKALLEVNWDTDKYHESAGRALKVLLEELDRMEKSSSITTSVVGHSHIDVAWLWRLKHTREKAQRTFSTVLRYMEEFDEYVFMHSSPQVYKDIKSDAPELYEKIKKRVAEGRWEPDGGMWLEADCNITSGESLSRQFIHGIRFFMKEFGKKSEYLWLPDVFGYSWALPQILKKVGIDTFATTKISWNQFNSMPNDVFRWRGLDGSEVMTYFIDIPTGPDTIEERFSTYNGLMSAATTLGGWRRFKNKELTKNFLLAYGHGDGGGGVDHDMLKMRRAFDRLPGVPAVKPEKAGDFFRRLHEKLDEDEGVPVWDGELYLEYHRGTYTSQGNNKKWNRKMEFLLRDAEWLESLSYILGDSYEGEKLYEIWETILELQFHDIIPGSSIREVYEDSDIMYEKACRDVTDISSKALSKLVEDEDDYFTIYNSSGFARKTEVLLPVEGPSKFIDEKGNKLYSQKVENGYLVLVELEPLSFMNVIVKEAENCCDSSGFTYENGKAETPFYTITFDENGSIKNIYDKEFEREVLKGKGNVLEVYEDKPMSFDNWDLDYYYVQKKECFRLASPTEVIENGKLCLKLKTRYEYNESSIEQIMTLHARSRRIDFETHVSWHESHRLLKAAFETDIRSTKATYDIQYGHAERPTHANTSWDAAKFEVVGQKWADISEYGYGVALLNDCKYGYSVKDGKMTLSLLKSGKYPDMMADMGEHDFTYSLYPHGGDLVSGKVIEESTDLNIRPGVLRGRNILEGKKLFNIDSDSVVVDAIKKAEDDNGIIVRFHECHGGSAKISITSDFGIKDYTETNILEEKITETVTADRIERTVKPFEIVTMLVHF